MSDFAEGAILPGPDYTAVDSREKAERLVERGELVALLMLPEAFGGAPVVENIVYVPPYVADRKADIDQTQIVPMVMEGKVTEYRVDPKYQGRSLVPIALDIEALNPQVRDPRPFVYRLAIWGAALKQGSR